MTVLTHQGESIAVTVQSFPAGASDGGRRIAHRRIKCTVTVNVLDYEWFEANPARVEIERWPCPSTSLRTR
jgi:hypothetical protein